MRTLRIAGLLCTLVLGAAGCGSSEATETVERFKDAVADGDLRRACDELTEAAKSRFFHGDCRRPDATEFSSPPFDSYVDADASAYSVVNLAGERRIDHGSFVDVLLDERAVDALTDAHTYLGAYGLGPARPSWAGATVAALVEVANELDRDTTLLETANFSTFETTETSYSIGVTSLTGTEFLIIRRPAEGARESSADPTDLIYDCEPVGGRCPSDGDFLEGDYEFKDLADP